MCAPTKKKRRNSVTICSLYNHSSPLQPSSIFGTLAKHRISDNDTNTNRILDQVNSMFHFWLYIYIWRYPENRFDLDRFMLFFLFLSLVSQRKRLLVSFLFNVNRFGMFQQSNSVRNLISWQSTAKMSQNSPLLMWNKPIFWQMCTERQWECFNIKCAKFNSKWEIKKIEKRAYTQLL